MKILVPDYYPLFRCTAGKCRHNCCIGWEIDIDSETMDFYDSVKGNFGERLRKNIDREECPHFRLGDHDRCPFLNSENLCDIYINLGEEHLCSICADHPRFRNFIGGRCEMGLGLTCEAAAELILTRQEKTVWIEYGEDAAASETSEWEEEILKKRRLAVDILQNRDEPIGERIGRIAADVWFGCSPEQWAEFFGGLERMDEGWSNVLALLTAENARWSDVLPEYVWEQLIVYFVNRHTPDAEDELDFEARLAFAVLSYGIIRTVCEGVFRRKGSISAADIAEAARMYSSEIEYSEENTGAVYSELEELL